MIPHSILVLYRLLSLLCALAYLNPHTNLPFSGEEFWSSERLSTLLEGTELMNGRGRLLSTAISFYQGLQSSFLIFLGV